MIKFDLSLLSSIMIGCFSLSLFWVCQSAMESGSKKYRSTFEQQTNAGLSDLFVFIDPAALWAPLILIAVSGSALAYMLLKNIFLGAMIFLLFLLTPRHLIKRAKRSRLLAFDQQLPEACTRISTSLKSGMAMMESIKVLVCTSHAPMSQELSLVLRENRAGIPLDKSLQNLQCRMPTENCRIMTAALMLSLRSGGAVANLLDQVGQTIRQRLHLARKLRMMTSQGKMQAWCIGLLPILMLIVLSNIDPEISGNMLNDDLGRGYLAVLVLLEMAGCLLLRKILHPRF